MKVLSFDRHCGTEPTHPCGTDLHPDSSIIKDGKPFFVPPFSESWSYHIGAAFRNGRLGKNVAGRFASRYLDAFTLCVLTRPDSALAAFDRLRHGLLNSHEGAVILGEWIPLTPEATSLKATVGDLTLDMTGEISHARHLFSEASAICVMKIGDIIVTCHDLFAKDLPLGTVVSASVNDNEILRFRIK